jgi:hypothetical protein
VMPWTLIDSYAEDEDGRFLQNFGTLVANYKCHGSEDCSVARTNKTFFQA